MYKPVNNPQNAALDNVLNYGILFITSTNRQQTFFNMLEEQVAADNRVRAAGCFFGRLRHGTCLHAPMLGAEKAVIFRP